MEELKKILHYFNYNISNKILEQLEIDTKLANRIEEIRLRVNRPIILKLRNRDVLIEYYPNRNEILEVVERICNNSIYAYRNQICNGYVTIKGGHRIRINRNSGYRK